MPTQDQLWAAWVDQRIGAAIKAHENAAVGAIGDVIAEERQRHDKAAASLRREIEGLSEQVATLTERIAQLEARPAVPSIRAVS